MQNDPLVNNVTHSDLDPRVTKNACQKNSQHMLTGYVTAHVVAGLSFHAAFTLFHLVGW